MLRFECILPRPAGKYFLNFKQGIDQMEDAPDSLAKYIDGPPTFCFSTFYVSVNGGTPLKYHNRLIIEGNLDKHDPFVCIAFWN